MRADTIDFLLKLNRTFYQTFVEPFSETRSRLQPGVLRCLERVAKHERVMDLGCGNGELARTLLDAGFQGRYLGVDSSLELLSLAMEKVRHPGFHFTQIDLTTPHWSQQLAAETEMPGAGFDRAFLFAVLHHIPGEALRKGLLDQIHAVLSGRGELMVSVWDFLASERLRERLLPWETVGLLEGEVDEGDYLIDWRRGGHGQRYVHHFQIAELRALARASGFEVRHSFRSDGEAGKLGLYLILEKIE